ncbi:GNAT family N-acetyltransferase [Teredinibacter sp. KSP-S5-2]|uniref:GNAT family N-acetyltransferase n=1 Tax=Teredinibacter sp. KSP-S5-2 TaxID=3034506 RepID=UPI002934B7C2|nr:GNAT family N-acetyltransferase [Teredinibacter sp. KSP-S5-2]WNO11235.1 GNAT family N-acetyltransferase [Teredinibacter sp. KSP-S5-2]
MSLRIEQVEWTTANTELHNIRKEVFCQEQGFPEKDEVDEWDHNPTTLHLLAYSRNLPAGTVRVLNTGQIGRLAVLPQFRQQGIGSQLLVHATRHALIHCDQPVFLNAQQHAIHFYQQLGFQAAGDVHTEYDVTHQRMIFTPESAERLENLFQDQVIRPISALEFAHHLAAMVQPTLRYVDIYSHHLQTGIFANPRLVDALSRFARSNRRARIRMLVHTAKPLYGSNHPLITLAQRISSKVAIRVINEDPMKAEVGFCICDKRRLIYFNDEQNQDGFVNYQAPRESESCLEEFDRYWQKYSDTDPNLTQFIL